MTNQERLQAQPRAGGRGVQRPVGRLVCFPLATLLVVYTLLALTARPRPPFDPARSEQALAQAGWSHHTLASTGWVTETIAPGFADNISLVLDGDGRPHISYCFGNPIIDFKYAAKDDTGWRLVTMDADICGGGSIAVTGNSDASLPHLNWGARGYSGSAQTCGFLSYAYRDSAGVWQQATVEGPTPPTHLPNVGGGAIALDSSGHPHIGYCSNSIANNPSTLKYAYRGGADWQIGTVYSVPGVSVCAGVSLALDGRNAHLSFTDRGDIKYAYTNGAGWHIMTVDSVGALGGSTIKLWNSYPHITYVDGYPNRAAKYAYADANGWHYETVISGVVLGGVAFALDGQGNPHISYKDSTLSALRHAYKDDTGWHFETVDNSAGSSAIAVDENGNIHIAYKGVYGLMYAYKGLVVNSTADRPDAATADAACDTGQTLPSGDPECTLRAAIQQANATPGRDNITFKIPGAADAPVITPASALPSISEAVSLDATTQPGAGRVELNGIGAGTGTNGLTFNVGDCTVKGLTVKGFDGNGIRATASNDITLHNVEIRDNKSDGIRADQVFISRAVVSNNGVSNLGCGIRVAGMLWAADIVVQENKGHGIYTESGGYLKNIQVLRNAYTGIVMPGAGGDSVEIRGESNQVIGNGQAGIDVAGFLDAANIEVRDNQSDGIRADSLVIGNATITNNGAAGGGYGIWSEYSVYVINTVVQANQGFGI